MHWSNTSMFSFSFGSEAYVDLSCQPYIPVALSVTTPLITPLYLFHSANQMKNTNDPRIRRIARFCYDGLSACHRSRQSCRLDGWDSERGVNVEPQTGSLSMGNHGRRYKRTILTDGLNRILRLTLTGRSESRVGDQLPQSWESRRCGDICWSRFHGWGWCKGWLQSSISAEDYYLDRAWEKRCSSLATTLRLRPDLFRNWYSSGKQRFRSHCKETKAINVQAWFSISRIWVLAM